jgi:hypothetical protein
VSPRRASHRSFARASFCYTDPSALVDCKRQAMFAMCIRKPVGEWLSLVEHLVRDQGVGGSNPLSPTIKSRNIN